MDGRERRTAIRWLLFRSFLFCNDVFSQEHNTIQHRQNYLLTLQCEGGRVETQQNQKGIERELTAIRKETGDRFVAGRSVAVGTRFDRLAAILLRHIDSSSSVFFFLSFSLRRL